jgi:hypothetical protein
MPVALFALCAPRFAVPPDSIWRQTLSGEMTAPRSRWSPHPVAAWSWKDAVRIDSGMRSTKSHQLRDLMKVSIL